MRLLGTLCVALLSPVTACADERQAQAPLDQYISEAHATSSAVASPGSLYAPTGRYSDLARDLRSFQLHDLLTIVVSDRASAVARGTTNTARKSNAKAGVTAILGPQPSPGALTDLLRLNSETQLQGQGETSRETTLTTTLSARVTHLLPNGFLVVEGIKDIQLNSERQRVSIRGVVRPYDVSAANTVSSDRLAHLEVRIDGKGVVGDAIRRPHILYRILLGLLPF